MTDAVVPMSSIAGGARRSADARARASTSDEALLEALYTELAPTVLGYLRAHRAADPEDLLGEVFFQVARDFHRFRGDDAARRRWVFTIAHNRLVDAWRRQSARPTIADQPVPERSAPDATADVDPALIDALQQLTPDQREVVVLRFVADLPARDVARITRRRLGAVKALQQRGLASLERTLETTSGRPC